MSRGVMGRSGGVVNSEHVRKPKNARRNINSRVESMNGDEYPEQRVKMQRARRSAVRGKHLGATIMTG